MIMIVEVMGIPEFVDSGRKCWTLGSELWFLRSGHWTLETTLWTLSSGYWTLLLPGSEQNQNPVSNSS